MVTLTGLEPAFIVLETTAYPPCSRVYLYVALPPGFEPELRRPQHRVLTNYTKAARTASEQDSYLWLLPHDLYWSDYATLDELAIQET